MKFNCNIELEEALFSRGTITFQDSKYPTPLKAYPAGKLTDTEQSPLQETRRVAEIYCRIDRTDLQKAETYLDYEGSTGAPDFIEEDIEEPIREIGDDELVFVFFEIKETHELGPEDIRRYIKLSTKYSDFVVMPHQAGLIRHMLNSKGRGGPGDEELPDNLYNAYYNGVTEFLEQSEAVEEPVMGILPLFKLSHQRNEHLQDFAAYNVEAVGVDFRQKSPKNVGQLKYIIDGIRDRGLIEDTILYALNPRYVSKKTDGGYWIAEDFLLGAQSFDIIGETNFGFGGSSGAIESIRVFDRDVGAYDDVPLSELWKICGDSGISDLVIERDPDEAVNNKRLLCCEQIELEFENLRDAIDDDDEDAFEYLRGKEGVNKDALDRLRNLGNFYSFAGEGGFDQY